MEDQVSEWTTHKSGIRQGSPLSAYLFIIVMSCLSHDTHSTAIHQKLAAQRVAGMEEDEVLYADDILCDTQTKEEMTSLLEAI